MHRLLILRHAHSEPAGPSGDRARGLSDRGRAQCRDVLDWMRERKFSVDAVVCSPARRTLETWTEIETVAAEAEVHTPEGMYLGDLDVYRDAIAATDAGTVLLVGHNPTCAQLATSVSGAADLHPMLAQGRFPTASLCVVDTSEDAWRAIDVHVPGRSTA